MMSHSLVNIHVHPSVSDIQLARLVKSTGLVAMSSSRTRGIVLLTREQAMIKRAAADLHKGAPCR